MISNAQNILKNLLSTHDLNILEYKEWLLVDEALPAINASTYDYKEKEGKGNIRLDINVMLDKNKIISESFIGWGNSELAATQNAFQNFIANSYYVLLAALWQVSDYEHVGIEEWEIDNKIWEVYIGNFASKGDFNIPENLFSTIEEQIKDEKLEENIYWIRFYYANINSKENLIEGLKNNQTWGKLEIITKEINWPKSDNFYSLRNFIILRRIK